MYTIKTPATSANIGPGFDCLGIALTIYNSFDVSLSEKDELDHVEDRFNNPENLFLQAYHKGCESIGISDHIHASFHCEIPVSRGLGSSSSLIVGGLTAASVLHDDALSDDQIFELAAEIEGHPDNAAPCVYGGLTASLNTGDRFITHQIPLASGWQFYVFIPDFEVSTNKARAILPESYPRNVASGNAAHAILTTEALRNGNPAFLRVAAKDQLHEPYRKQLIEGYDDLKKITEEATDGTLLISGSGSTCILITKSPLSKTAAEKIHNLPHNWQIHSVKEASEGTEIWGDDR